MPCPACSRPSTPVLRETGRLGEAAWAWRSPEVWWRPMAAGSGRRTDRKGAPGSCSLCRSPGSPRQLDWTDMSGAHILVVDDEPAILPALRANLAGHGFGG